MLWTEWDFLFISQLLLYFEIFPLIASGPTYAIHFFLFWWLIKHKVMTVTKTKCKHGSYISCAVFLSVNIQRTGRNFCFWLRQSDRDRNPPPAWKNWKSTRDNGHHTTKPCGSWDTNDCPDYFPETIFRPEHVEGNARRIQRNPWVEEKELRFCRGTKCIGWSTEEAKVRQKTLESAEDPPQVLAEYYWTHVWGKYPRKSTTRKDYRERSPNPTQVWEPCFAKMVRITHRVLPEQLGKLFPIPNTALWP